MEYRILADNRGRLERLITKQNTRAIKLGLDPITWSYGPVETVAHEDGVRADEFVTVTIEGGPPVLEGYRFVGTIQHMPEVGNVLRIVPGWDTPIPEQFRDSDPERCDHCHQTRRRTDTFLVYNPHMTDPYSQVGRQCLADFVGSDKVGAFAAMAEIMILIREAAESLDERGPGSPESKLVLEEVLAWAAEAMLRAGWLSRSKAEASNKTATADLAISALNLHAIGEVCRSKCADPCLNHFVPSERATKIVADALAWAPDYIERQLAATRGTNADGDYIWNLKVILANEVIPLRSFALAASVLGAYQRDLEREARFSNARAESTSEFVGTVGEKIVLTLTAKAFRYLDSEYGVTTLITYHDDAGNMVKWYASGELTIDLEETATYEMTVKDHRQYQGICETHVKRVRPYISPDAKKALTKARAAAKKSYEALKAVADEAWIGLAVAGTPEHASTLATYNTARDAASAAHDAWKNL